MQFRIAIVLFLVLLAACKREAEPAAPSAPAAQPQSTQPARPARIPAAVEQPALRIATLDGKTFDLAEQRGQWVVVNYWATWCGPCIEEMPELSALDAMREHIEVIGLAYEDIAVEDMRAFLEKRPVVYPIAILDVYDPPKDFATPRGLPVTYLIAPDGKVARQFVGPVDARQVEQAIAEAGGKPG